MNGTKLFEQMCGRDYAWEFLSVYLPDVLDDEDKTEEFCEQYQKVLNRIRYEFEKLDEIEERAEAAERERDAAIKDLKWMADCETCGHYNLLGHDQLPCIECKKGEKWVWKEQKRDNRGEIDKKDRRNTVPVLWKEV